MRWKRNWKSILVIGVIASLVSAVLLTSLLFWIGIIATTFSIALSVHISIFILIGVLLSFNLCLDSKRNKLFETIILSILFSIILLLIVAFIANKNDPFIYALLGLGIIAPVIVFIFGIFGVFIYFISKVSGRIGGISLDIFQKFKRKK